jgi:hypothetical protein
VQIQQLDGHRFDQGGAEMESRIIYFEEPGKINTSQVLSLVKDRAQTTGIAKIVLASTRGTTAREFAEALAGTGVQLVVIPWQYGFKNQPQPFPTELAIELQEKGHRVHFGTMLFHTEGFYGMGAPTVMANLLRIFGQGIKVCVEIILMACDGGCIQADETVIAVAGTVTGADTAVVATPAPSTRLAGLRVHEIICKPLLMKGKGEE